ncbi:hypothetical protein ACVWYG_000463 [Pedobacter sp. UYEF25]
MVFLKSLYLLVSRLKKLGAKLVQEMFQFTINFIRPSGNLFFGSVKL